MTRDNKAMEKISELHMVSIAPNDVERYILDNVPSNYKVKPEFKEVIHELINENPRVRDSVIDLFVSQQEILRGGGRYDLNQYINACRFVSYTLMGISDIKSYKMTFPDRYSKHYEKYQKKGITNPDTYIAIHVTGYKKSRLVAELTENTLVPLYVLNVGIAQRAVNKLAYLMDHSESEKIQLESSKGLLEYLKIPEKLFTAEAQEKIEEGISAMDSLRDAISSISRDSKKMISKGTTTITDIEIITSESLKANNE